MADGEASAEPNKRARHGGPVRVIARLQSHPGLDGPLETVLRALAADVDAVEKGCTAYAVTREIGSSSHFAVHARFADWAAFKQHPETAHFNRALPTLTARLAAPVALEIFLEV